MNLILDPTAPLSGGQPDRSLEANHRDRGPVRHFIIATPPRLRATIRHLHARGYAESHLWTPPLHIPPDGLIIRPSPAEMYVYLERQHWQD